MAIFVPYGRPGSRFAEAGFKDPNLPIPVRGVPRTKLVIDNFRASRAHRLVFGGNVLPLRLVGLLAPDRAAR